MKRLRNIAENPAVALVVDRYDEDWARLGWVMLRGPAGGVCGERDLPVFHACRQVGGFTGFRKVPIGNEDGVVVPEPSYAGC